MDIGALIDGRYRLVRELASGGMGTVWVAEHVALKKQVAVKLLRPEAADLPGATARFEREARATSQLDDPHIVRVLDFGRTAEGMYLVMELLEGRPLTAIIEEGRLEPKRAIDIADQVLAALQVAHASSLVHRDLKPDNIVVREVITDDVKVLDFGISALLDDPKQTKLTQVGMVAGTPSYLAPEQAIGVDVDARTDLHAVGVLLYEMLTARLPYEGENLNQLLHAIATGAPEPIEALRPGLPRALSEIVRRAMATKPADRYATATAFREALHRVQLGETQPAFALPARLETTGLGGTKKASEPAIVPVAIEAPIERPIELDRPLELDRPAPAPIPVEPKKPLDLRPLGIGAGALVLVACAVLGWRAAHAPTDAMIDLTDVPPLARLTLDGTPIVGTHLQLPISRELHRLVVAVPRKPPRTITFTAQHDDTLALGGP